MAEFKGPEISGVVRFAQVSMELARIDASFSGLTPGSHAWSINTYGDLTRGAASTGGVFQSESRNSSGSEDKVHANHRRFPLMQSMIRYDKLNCFLLREITKMPSKNFSKSP